MGESPRLDTVLRQIKNEGLLDDPHVKKLVRVAVRTENEHLQQRIAKALRLRVSQHQTEPFTAPEYQQGVRLGDTSSGAPVELAADSLTKHVLVVGQTGAGKTTLFYNLMDRLEVPFWTFDLKQDYRHLVSERSDLLVLPWNRFRFNPLQPPPGVTSQKWAQVLVEVFGHANSLLSGSKNYLLKHILELYQEHDLEEEDYPSVFDLQNAIYDDTKSHVRKSANYRDTVLNRLESLTMTAGDVVDCRHGVSLEELLEQNVVFEFEGLNRDIQNVLMELLFAWVYEYRLASGERNQGLKHIFFLDEAKRLFSTYKERQDAAGLPEIDDLTAKMREFGEGLIAADQEATKLTDSLKANTYTKLLLSVGEEQQLREMADAMQLDKRQRQQVHNLEIGEAIVQQGNQDLVRVKLAPFDIEKSVSDNDLATLQKDWWNNLVADGDTSTKREAEEPTKQAKTDENSLNSAEEPENSLTELEEKLLKQIIEFPFKSISERYEDFSSISKGNKAKKELLERGFIKEENVALSDGRVKLLELTDDGRGYLQKQGVEVNRSGRGGVVHRYWQHKLKELFEQQGVTARIEDRDADVGLETDGVSIALEVALSDSDREIQHVNDRLLDDFDAVIVACLNNSVQRGISEKLEDTGLNTELVNVRVLRKLPKAELL